MRTIRYTLPLLLAALLTACNNSTPEQRVHQILTDRIQTLATAESCTGGTLAARFTAIPGASAYFKGGLVTYSNTSKHDLLGVDPDTLSRYGAVSEQVAQQMAECARHLNDTHFAIATTGIAGPSGGTPETPVGTVWIAVSSPLSTRTRLIHIQGDRDKVIQDSGTEAIKLLEEVLASEQ